MSMTVKTTARGDLLHVLAAGEFSLDEAKRTFVEVVEAVTENDCDKVLFDGRVIKGEPTVIERFYYGEFVADIVKQIREASESVDAPRFAYVLIVPVLDRQRLGETVAINRGVDLKAFDDPDEAMSWLGFSADDITAFKADGM